MTPITGSGNRKKTPELEEKELNPLEFSAEELGISPEKELALQVELLLFHARLQGASKISQQLGAAIAPRRKELEISKEQVAAMSNLTLYKYTQIERGRGRPTLVETCHIATALQVSAEKLLNLAGL